jgi:transposase
MTASYNITAVIKLYKEGMSTIKLAKMFGCSISSIRNILVRYNIPMRTQKETQKAFLEKDPNNHPTRGRHHTEESKNKTSESMKKYHEKKKKRDLKNNGKTKKTDRNTD